MTNVAAPVLEIHSNCRALLLSVLLLVPVSVHGDSVIEGTQIEEVVREINVRQKAITSLRATFKQERSLSLLADLETSSGTFVYAKPNKVVWSYREPKPVTMLISDGWMTTWYPELRKAEKIEIHRFEDKIFRYMGAVGGALEDLGRYFDFRFTDTRSEPSFVLELTPKTRNVERRVRKMTVWIDRETYLTHKFEYVEGDGDLTRYEFTDIEINPEIDPATFQLNLPEDVRVEKINLNR